MTDNYFILYRKYDSLETYIKADGDSTYDDLCRHFEDFLRGCGYVFTGHVEVVGDYEEEET